MRSAQSNMQKTAIHLLIFLCLFFGLWWSLSHVRFIELSHIDEISKDNERKIGNLIIDVLEANHPEMEGEQAKYLVDSLKEIITLKNNLKEKSTIYILKSDEINAFALPGNNLVIYSALINYCKTPEELTGVIAHELAHIEHHHISKKLAKEIGLSALVSAADKNVGSVIAKQLAQTITSTGYDRAMEREADKSAVEYVTKAQINREQLANFLLRLSNEEKSAPTALEWFSTHPDTKERVADILSQSGGTPVSTAPILSDSLWQYVRTTLGTTRHK